MCWATPSSCDSSPIVRRAPGSLSAGTERSALRDPVAHDLAGAEGHDPPRRDRDFDARFRIAADPLALVAQDEGSEARHLDVLADGQGLAHVVQDALHEASRFGPR